jgi:hypothetical protein
MAKTDPSAELCWPNRCASTPASTKLPRLLVARAAQSPVIIKAAPPITTTKAPKVVSIRS